jgi:hypothetical protein
VKTTEKKAPSHMIIGTIHASNVIHVAIKKPPPKKKRSFKVTRHLQARKEE